MAITLEQFKDCLGKSGLMSPADLAAFQQSLPVEQRPADVPSLTAELIRQKKLTPYQASLLSQGQLKGLVFGEYTVQNKLGEGGMGVVVQAQHRYLKRNVALKVLHPSVTQSEDAVKRFHREVEAMARLSHPNIVAAYDANQQDGTYYFVMELVDGIDLARLVKEQGLLPVDRALDYMLQAASGLDHAHKKGVVHRDIKPSNLVLDGEGHIKILDMGLVRFTARDSECSATDPEGLTRTGDIMGSFDYIAPEQAIDTKRADQRADIYSLGCTLHFLLVGRPPYEGDTSMQKLLAHRENAIPSLRKVRPDVPLALDAVFHRMVAKKADDRYPSMSEVIADLDACKRTAEPGAGEKGALSTVTFHAPPQRSGMGRLVLVCGTLCILAALGSEVFLSYQAAVSRTALPDDGLLIKGAALALGGVMVAVGLLMAVVGAVSGRAGLRPGQRPGPRPGEVAWLIIRWLLGTFAGLIVGAIAGAAIGGALANTESSQVRVAGGLVVGAFAGAALARRRTWLVMFGCGLAGYFVGGVIGKYGLSLTPLGIGLELPGDTTAMLGFAVVGAIVGAVFGAERRDTARSRSAAEALSAAPAPPEHLAADPVAVDKTVRRVAGHP